MAVRGKHGAMLAGRYRLLEQLGEGGMGSVWKAEHLLLHSHVAIKIIDPEVARLEFNLARFLREAKTLASLRSPNVVQVLDFGSDADTPYLVMELLQGQTLGRRVSERGRLSLGETSGILEDVCTAMSLVHDQGLIHRDLKPDNIFLCNTGDQRVSKVVDFGIAKSLRGDTSTSMKTRTGHMLGTPSYMSPEQCRGLKDIDHRADLWALGVITYQCLVGKVPFQGEVLGDLLLQICMDPLPIPSEHAQGLPRTFDAWFAKAVARDRSARFQSALELAASLAALTRAVSLGTTASVREAIEPSRPSAPRPVASAPSRVGSTTETNTTIGLGTASGRRLAQRARILAVASVGACALAGLWAIGKKGHPAGAVGVDMQTLRPAYELTPKVIRPGVQSGRRWMTSPPAAAGGSLAEGKVGLWRGEGLAAIATTTARSPTSVPSALRPDGLPPTSPDNPVPNSAVPSNSVPSSPLPSSPLPSNSVPSSRAPTTPVLPNLRGSPGAGLAPPTAAHAPAPSTPLRGSAAAPSTPRAAPPGPGEARIRGNR